MDEQELYEYLKDQRAMDVIRTLYHEVEMLEPNGANVHFRSGLQCSFSSLICCYEAGVYPDVETFSGYRERNEVACTRMIKKIARAITELHLTI